MALVLNPALSMAASGNLGGICYAHWRGSAIARGAWTGTQTSTTLQLVRRAAFSYVTKYWSSSLTQAQRDAWTQFAAATPQLDRFGRSYHASGFQIFVQFSMIKYRCSSTIPLIPPTAHENFCLTLLTLTAIPASGYVRVVLAKRVGTSYPTYFQIQRTRGFANPGRGAISPDYREVFLGSSFISWNDTGVVLGEYYWYRGRGIASQGFQGNWFVAQVHYI